MIENSITGCISRGEIRIGEEIKIQIYNVEDRLEIAKILVKNGYTVSQGSEAIPGKKANVYFVKAKQEEGNLVSK